MLWCPYTGSDIKKSEANTEHIIPLSLGGSNSFCLPVDKEFNSKLGSDVDGAVSNDFIVGLRRRAFDAKGHGGKSPKTILRSNIINEKRPVSVTLRGEELPIIYDHKTNKEITPSEVPGAIFESRLRIERWAYLKFTAKVALATGYLLYGDLFKENVRHEDLRKAMNFSPQAPKSIFDDVQVSFYDPYTPPEPGQETDYARDKLMCELINGSCVVSVPCTQNIIFIVGVLGEWVGTINVPAITDNFPMGGEHDLGHAILLVSKQKITMSYRQLLLDMQKIISKGTSE